MAFLMVLSCILGMDWLSPTAYAYSNGSGASTNANTGTAVGALGFPDYCKVEMVYALYFTDGIGDGPNERYSYDKVTDIYAGLTQNSSPVTKYRNSAIFLSPSVSGSVYLWDSVSSTESKSAVNTVKVHSPAGAWKDVFSTSDYVGLEPGRGYYNFQYPNRFNQIRESHDYSVEWEWENFYKPILSYFSDDMQAIITRAYAAHEPLTLVIEPYWRGTVPGLGSAYVSMLEVSNYYTQNYLTAARNFSTAKGTVGYGIGPLYRAILNSDEYMIYYSSDGRLSNSQSLYSANTSVVNGWGFYTLCNGKHGEEITIDLTKVVDVKSSGNADASAFKDGVEASYTVYARTEEDLIAGMTGVSPNSVNMTDKSAAGVFSAIKDAHYGWNSSNVKNCFTWGLNATGVRTNTQFTSNKKVTFNMTLKDATKVWYFCVVENEVESTYTECDVVSAPTPGCIILKYVPTVSNGKVTGVTWSYADLKSTCLPNDGKLCSFEVTSTSKNNVSLRATNPFEITSEPSADFISANATVLDVDDYYVTGYKTDYGFLNNRQLVYTRSTLINPGNAAFIPAYSLDSSVKALNNSQSDLDKAASDNNVKTLNVPKDSATYAQQGVTSRNGTIQINFQPDANKTFTVNKDFIRDYGNIRSNPSSISSAFSNVIRSAETDCGTLSIPFNGGETYSVGNNTTSYDDYIKYAEMYAKYEAAIAASAGEVRGALTHWSAEAMDLYAEAQSIYSSISSSYSGRTESAVESAWSRIDAISDKLEDITGWTLQFKAEYYVPYMRCNYCDSRYCDGYHREFVGYYYCNSSVCSGHREYDYRYQGKYTDYDTKYFSRNGGSTLGVKIKPASSGITTTNLPAPIKNIFTGGGTVSTSSLIGRLCDINTEQLKEIVRLEKGRPHAEIHQYTEFATEYDDTIYKATDVPEWYVAMRWKDQKAFLKNGSLLSTLLDFEATAPKLSNPAFGTGKEVDTAPLVLLQKVPESYNKHLRGSFTFRNNESSSTTTTAYSPLFAWYYQDSSLLEKADKVVEEMGTGSFTTSSKTKNGKFVLNSSKTSTKDANLVYYANLDAFGYAQTAIASWTSVWQITDDNPTNDFLPGTDWANANSAYLPSDVSAAIIAAAKLPNAKRKNMASAGSNAKGTDTYVIGNPDAKSQAKTRIFAVYSKNALTQQSSSLMDYYVNGYKVGNGGKIVQISGVTSAATNWLSDKVPYTLTTEFNHFNVGNQPGTPYFDPENLSTSNNDPTKPSSNTDSVGGGGRYTRDPDKEVFSIYPLVKRGYYEQLGSTPKYTYTVGQKSRTLNSHVYYYMGITGTANPTVVANSLGSGSAAMALSNRADGAPVALSGTGITVSYDSNLALVFQSFNLCNIDADQSYQDGWGNVINENETAHMEWLHSMGATSYTSTAADGTSVTTLGIPYIAGVDCNINNKASAWQLTQNAAKVAMKNDNAQGTQEFIITMRVEKGELTEVTLPTAIIAPADGSATIAKGTFRGTTTAQTLARMPSYLADAIRGVGITGKSDCVLKQTFVNNAGTVMVKDANGNVVSTVAAEGSKWYNEYCYCIGLKFASTVFNMQPLMFTDKIPIELGPKTPASKNDYYKDGYGFVAQSLMLKIGAAPDPTQTSISAADTGVEDLLDEVWMISRDNPKVDLVISNVPVTGANS